MKYVFVFITDDMTKMISVFVHNRSRSRKRQSRYHISLLCDWMVNRVRCHR